MADTPYYMDEDFAPDLTLVRGAVPEVRKILMAAARDSMRIRKLRAEMLAVSRARRAKLLEADALDPSFTRPMMAKAIGIRESVLNRQMGIARDEAGVQGRRGRPRKLTPK